MELKRESHVLGIELQMLEAENFVDNMLRWLWEHRDENWIPVDFSIGFNEFSDSQKMHAFMYQAGCVWGMMEAVDDEY